MFHPDRSLILPIVVGIEFRGVVESSYRGGALRLLLIGYTVDRSDYHPVCELSVPPTTDLGADQFEVNDENDEATLVLHGLRECGAIELVAGKIYRLLREKVRQLADEAGLKADEAEPAACSAP